METWDEAFARRRGKEGAVKAGEGREERQEEVQERMGTEQFLSRAPAVHFCHTLMRRGTYARVIILIHGYK